MSEVSSFVGHVHTLAIKLMRLPNRQETLERCISEKLRHSEDIYNEQLKEAYEYLLSRDNLKVVRAIAKARKGKGV